MADSSIEWTDKSWNPVAGCARVSPGCENCYAETMAARHVLMSAAQGRTSPYLPVVDAKRRRWNRKFITLPERLADPLSWRKPARVFVNSMSDLFGAGVPFEYVAAVFGVMAATPRHTYQVLTKRPARMLEFFAWAADPKHDNSWLRDSRRPNAPTQIHLCMEYFARQGPVSLPFQTDVSTTWPISNVWLGVSVENQAAADERIPLLLQAPAAVRFLSCEPLLGPVDLDAVQIPHEREGLRFSALRRQHDDRFGSSDTVLDWIIVGGESGPGARPCDLAWLRSLVRQCSEVDVPVFVKQLGAWPIEPRDPRNVDMDRDRVRLDSKKGGDPAEWPEDLRVRQWPRTEG